jgi:toxin-antitoxin system PIN domain toxin
MTDLLDVNVWLALVDENHVHHAAAVDYWQKQAADTVAFCRISLLGFLRLATRKGVLGRTLTPDEAWTIIHRYLAEPGVVLLDEPAGIDEAFARYTSDPGFLPSDWTDAYLAGFAVTADCRLVSFDAGFVRYPGLERLHLTPIG